MIYIESNIKMLGVTCLFFTTLLFLDKCLFPFCYSFRYPNEVSNRWTCTVYQSWFLYFCTSRMIMSGTEMTNMVPYSNLNILTQSMAGYFLYDLYFLMRLPRDRAQPVFIVHHLVSLTIFLINYVQQIVPDRESYMLLLLLESASPLLNVWNIWREIYPQSFLTRALLSSIKVVYGLSRIVGMSFWFLWYKLYYAQWKWNHIINTSSLMIIYLASLFWFHKLVKKN
jgi:hypothetical protein